MSKKIALVTGGIGGIGTQICRRLATAGWQVVANHLPSEVEATQRWLEQQRADGLRQPASRHQPDAGRSEYLYRRYPR